MTKTFTTKNYVNSTNISWDIVIAVQIVHLDLTVIVIVVVRIVPSIHNVLIHKVKNILIIDLIQEDKIIILIPLIEIKDRTDREEIHKGTLIMIEILTMARTIIEIIIIEIRIIKIIEMIGMIGMITIKSKIRTSIRAMTLKTVGREISPLNQIPPKVQ
jgi:hypothetical protein